MRFRLWGQNFDGWHISWVAIPEHVGWCELLNRCLRHIGVEAEEGISSDSQCLHLLKPAWVQKLKTMSLGVSRRLFMESLTSIITSLKFKIQKEDGADFPTSVSPI